jgi:hypothetical protein
MTTAVVINDEHAVVSDETLFFYLKGIFGDDDMIKNVRSTLPENINGLTFVKLDQILSNICENQPKCRESFAAHRETTNKNRRAYSTSDRVNKNSVFWPNPVDPNNVRSLYSELPFARRIPLIDKSTRIVSAGSCFAVEIAHALQQTGYNYIVKENNKGKYGQYEFVGSNSLPNASAAWGILFNTPSFRQLVEKAFGHRILPKVLWSRERDGKTEYLDPFREEISFESVAAFEKNYHEHINAARSALLDMDVFIITLGLNEVWYFKADSAVFSRSPWRTSPLLVGHKVLSVEENVNDLLLMTDLLRIYNPEVSVICSLSPVPLHATFRGDEAHVVTANAHSKSVLRVAAEEFTRRRSNVFYFPSYEVVTSCTKDPWAEDQRHVSAATIKNVMSLFHTIFDK